MPVLTVKFDQVISCCIASQIFVITNSGLLPYQCQAITQTFAGLLATPKECIQIDSQEKMTLTVTHN